MYDDTEAGTIVYYFALVPGNCQMYTMKTLAPVLSYVIFANQD